MFKTCCNDRFDRFLEDSRGLVKVFVIAFEEKKNNRLLKNSLDNPAHTAGFKIDNRLHGSWD